MNLPDYMRNISQDLLEQSKRIARDIEHAVSAGDAREEAVAKVLGDFLPEAFGVARGFIFSSDGERSSQTDLIIYDKLWSRPFYGQNNSKFFAVESVYATIEVKIVDFVSLPSKSSLVEHHQLLPRSRVRSCAVSIPLR